MFSIDIKSRAPIYEQLYNNVIKLIALGLLKPQDKLPTVRALAGDLGVNPNTVAKTYQLLERDNIIYTAVGRGAFVSDTLSGSESYLNSIKQETTENVKKCKDFGINHNDVIQIVDKVYNTEDSK